MRLSSCVDDTRPRLHCLLAGALLWLAAAPALAQGYADPQQAFDVVFIRSGLGVQGYRENREYAAAIYQMPDRRWYATAVSTGGLRSVSIPYDKVPSAAMRIVGAHTHGQPHVPGDPEHVYGDNFSDADRRAAIHNYMATRGRIEAQMLLTSRLELLRLTISQGYDPASGRISFGAQVSSLGSLALP